MSDPNVILNMKRIIGWRDGNNAAAKYGQYDIMYEVFIIVRRNQELFDLLVDRSDVDSAKVYLDRVYSVANDRVNLWMELATRTWRGGEAFILNEQEQSELSKQPEFPPASGSATVTVWGGIVDQQGRMMTLTITDQTVGIEALSEIPYTIGLYDAVTAISYGDDLSPYGNPVVRKTTVVSAEVTSRKAPPKAKATLPGVPTPKSNPSPFPPVPKIKDTVHCEKVSDLRNLNSGRFTIEIGGVSLYLMKNGSKLLNFHGFTDGATGLKLDKNSVFVYDNRKEFPAIVEALTNLGVQLNETDSDHTFETPIRISGQKMLSANNKAFYVDVKIV